MKNVLKIISASTLLLIIVASLFYMSVAPYPSASINSQLFNSNAKPCNTLETKRGEKGSLRVTPNISYLDDQVAIRISGLLPFQIGSLKLSLTDSKEIRWEISSLF